MIVSMPSSCSATGQAVDDVLEVPLGVPRGLVPGQRFRIGPRGPGQRLYPCRLCGELEHAPGERFGIAMGHEIAGPAVPHRILAPRTVRGERWRAAGSGFD